MANIYKVYDNYSAIVVKVNAHLPLRKLDNLVHVNIFGNMVLVNKNDTPVGSVGLFFPLETQINHQFLSANNLYRNSELNADRSKKGYFEDSGRVKATKFQGHNSMGFFMPLDSLNYLGLSQLPKLGDEFNDIGNQNICKKYIPVPQRTRQSNAPTQPKSRLSFLFNKALQEPKSILIDNQVKLHYDTSQLGKNMHIINLEKDMLHITSKLHGTSAVSHYTMTNRPLSLFERLLVKLGINIKRVEYHNIYTTRNTIKNHLLNREPAKDVWFYANEYVKDKLQKGMSFYYEIVGFQPNGKPVQKNYDYGCVAPVGNEEFTHGKHFKTFIYRITFTNRDGYVYEFTPKQVQQYCLENGLTAVPELWYGFANQLATSNDELLAYLQKTYLEFDDKLCVNKVPDEGIVVKINNGLQAYKLKSFRFFQHETAELNNAENNSEVADILE